jgi:hypothetical protein
MPGNKRKPQKPMTEDEHLDDALSLIVEGNAPFIQDIAGASYNYALSRVKEMLEMEMAVPGAQAGEILKKVEQLRFTGFMATRQ